MVSVLRYIVRGFFPSACLPDITFPICKIAPSSSSTLASRALPRLAHLARTMSTTTTKSHTPMETAPWKPLFASHLGGSSVEFTLATVTPDGLPRARTCIHRSFWATIPENSHNKLKKNPAIYESDCPAFTTDARMHKVYDVFATGKGKGDLEQSRSGTGGGGPVEAVYWIRDTGSQWRIRGKCWFISADDVEGEEQQNSGTVTVKSQVGRYMRPTKGNENGNPSDWSWKLEVENQFENLSPMMRGSFKNPDPGRPQSEPVENPAEKLGQTAGNLADEELARKNFRVAVITPEEVEQVDLSNPAEAKRWVWTLSKASGGPGEVKSANADGEGKSSSVGEWNMVETWP
jgi:pyridoxamine 5'-phosphate oxidase